MRSLTHTLSVAPMMDLTQVRILSGATLKILENYDFQPTSVSSNRLFAPNEDRICHPSLGIGEDIRHQVIAMPQ
jgi:hypothetical protein